MTRTKDPRSKVHITTTIAPEVTKGIQNFQDDKDNFVIGSDGLVEKQSRSEIVENALRKFLGKYVPAPPQAPVKEAAKQSG